MLDVACAVEILYHASLVHDELDGPFGQAHGINAGDALCAIAFLQLLDGVPRRPDERTVLMTRRLHEANYAMCSGQAERSGTGGGAAGRPAGRGVRAGGAGRGCRSGPGAGLCSPRAELRAPGAKRGPRAGDRDRPSRAGSRRVAPRAAPRPMSASARGVAATPSATRARVTPLMVILGVGLLVRLAFLPSLGFHNDIAAFEAWTLTLKRQPALAVLRQDVVCRLSAGLFHRAVVRSGWFTARSAPAL